MPLMAFIGEKNKNRRKPESVAARWEKGALRGWPKAKCMAEKKKNQSNANRGSGGSSWSGTYSYGGSSSSNQYAEDPSRTTWPAQAIGDPSLNRNEVQAWNRGWSTNDYWGWTQ